MYFTIPIQRTNPENGYKIDVNGLTNVTLRSKPDFDIDLYSLTAVPNENGVYENTTSITATNKYKLFINGVEEKSWGGTHGRDLISESNILNAEEFNVGETIVCAEVEGKKVFIPKTASSVPIKTLLILANVNGNQVSYDTLYDDFEGDVIFEKYGDEIDTGMYDINTLGNTDLSKAFISFQTYADSGEGFTYRYTVYPMSNFITITQYLDKNPTNSPNSFYIKLEIYP
jgi:hypothetical protein